MVETIKSSYSRGNNCSDDLRRRSTKENKSKKNIDFDRLFPFYSSSSYIISDQEGTEWAGLSTYVATEVKTGKASHDVALLEMALGVMPVNKSRIFRKTKRKKANTERKKDLSNRASFEGIRKT